MPRNREPNNKKKKKKRGGTDKTDKRLRQLKSISNKSLAIPQLLLTGLRFVHNRLCLFPSPLALSLQRVRCEAWPGATKRALRTTCSQARGDRWPKTRRAGAAQVVQTGRSGQRGCWGAGSQWHCSRGAKGGPVGRAHPTRSAEAESKRCSQSHPVENRKTIRLEVGGEKLL